MHASGGAIIFIRQSLSFSELSTSSLSLLDPYSDYVGVNISLNNSSSLSFNVDAPSICSSLMNGRTNSFSPSILPSSKNVFILGDFNCHHPLWDSRGTSDSYREKVFDWVISFDLLSLNDPDTPILLHCFSGSCSSPDTSFAPSCLALSCSWEVLQDLGSDHLPILLSVPLSLLPITQTTIPLPSIFRKLAGMGLPSTLTPTVLLQWNTRLFPLLLLSFTSLALNVAKFSIFFGHIKCPPKAWWSAEVESVVSERCKAFAFAHRSDEDHQAYISSS